MLEHDGAALAQLLEARVHPGHERADERAEDQQANDRDGEEDQRGDDAGVSEVAVPVDRLQQDVVGRRDRMSRRDAEHDR